MSIKIEIVAENATEMHKELTALLYGVKHADNAPTGEIPGRAPNEREEGAKETPEVEASKPETKRKRRSKAEIEAEKAAAEAAAKEAEATKEEEPEPEPVEEAKPDPTKEEEPKAKDINAVRQLIVAKGTSKKAAIGNLLKTKYGIKTLPQLDESRFGELYADIEAL